MSFYNSKKQVVTLGDRVGGGGEAHIYFVQRRVDVVAKIYAPAPKPATYEKVKWMMTHPPDDPSAKLGHRSIAWPIDALYDEQGQFVGYIMPRIRDAAVILNLFNPKRRDETGLDFNWLYLHRIAHNLATAIDAIHGRDYVIGDLNEGNVLVTRTALVTLIDTDSFQVRAHSIRGNKVFRCTVGKPDYTPPELQGKNFASVDRHPVHDRFGLGVMIFQLLTEGNHPFRSRWLGDGDAPSTSQKISNGWFPYDKSLSSRILPPPDMPSLNILHPKVAALFSRCFIAGHHDPRQRPRPKEWADVLDEAERDLKQCDQCGNFYSGHLKQCSWCAQRPLPPAQPRSNKPPNQSAPQSSPALKPTPPKPTPPAKQPPRPPTAGKPKKQPSGCARMLVAVLVLVAVAYFGWPYYAEYIPQLASILARFIPSVNRAAPPVAAADEGSKPVPVEADVQQKSSANLNTSSVIEFDIPCTASMLAPRRDSAVVPWAVDLRVVNVEVLPDALKLNFEAVRTGNSAQTWEPASTDVIALKTETGRFGLKRDDGAGGLFAQTTTLRPKEVHRGWLAFDEPDMDVFELMHPNVKPRFVIDLTNRQCRTI
jgi:serine/threonine protein kinase